jgi:hypothetical protein
MNGLELRDELYTLRRNLGPLRRGLAELASSPAPAPNPDYQPVPAWHHADMPYSTMAALVVNSSIVRVKVESEVKRLDLEAARGRALEIAAAVADLDQEAGYKMAVCNDPDQAELGICVHPDESGAPGVVMVKVRHRHCWLRVCPHCQPLIAARLRARYERRIRIVTAEPVKGWSLKSFVLTLDRQLDNDGAELKRLGALTRKVVKHFWGMKGAGAFATFEVGAKGGKLHAHGIAWGPYVDQGELSRYWKQLTGCQVVWIRRVSRSEALREGIKYIAKLSSRDDDGAFIMSAEQLARLHIAMRGKRRLRSWGCFYGMDDCEAEPEPEPEELAEMHQGERCDDGHRMIFVPVGVVRALLHLKGSIKCPVLDHPAVPLLPWVDPEPWLRT